MSGLLDRLREPGADGLDLDGAARLEWHRSVLARKRMTREVFLECHALLCSLDKRYLTGEGIAIEVGAGAAPMHDSYPAVLSADVVYAPHLDCVLDAQRMGLRARSVRVLYAQNAFHHFPEPERFFVELERVLSPGGGAILLDPFYGPAATFLFKRLFRSEGFDKTFPAWETPAAGPMNGANQALSYVIFVRDRGRFEARFPSLRIVHDEPVGNYLRYLVSGGLNFRQLLPDGATAALRLVESVLSPLQRVLALHHVIVLKKRAPGE
jgi:SAM-dependent methyltransferase